MLLGCGVRTRLGWGGRIEEEGRITRAAWAFRGRRSSGSARPGRAGSQPTGNLLTAHYERVATTAASNAAHPSQAQPLAFSNAIRSGSRSNSLVHHHVVQTTPCSVRAGRGAVCWRSGGEACGTHLRHPTPPNSTSTRPVPSHGLSVPNLSTNSHRFMSHSQLHPAPQVPRDPNHGLVQGFLPQLPPAFSSGGGGRCFRIRAGTPPITLQRTKKRGAHQPIATHMREGWHAHIVRELAPNHRTRGDRAVPANRARPNQAHVATDPDVVPNLHRIRALEPGDPFRDVDRVRRRVHLYGAGGEGVSCAAGGEWPAVVSVSLLAWTLGAHRTRCPNVIWAQSRRVSPKLL